MNASAGLAPLALCARGAMQSSSESSSRALSVLPAAHTSFVARLLAAYVVLAGASHIRESAHRIMLASLRPACGPHRTLGCSSDVGVWLCNDPAPVPDAPVQEVTSNKGSNILCAPLWDVEPLPARVAITISMTTRLPPAIKMKDLLVATFSRPAFSRHCHSDTHESLSATDAHCYGPSATVARHMCIICRPLGPSSEVTPQQLPVSRRLQLQLTARTRRGLELSAKLAGNFRFDCARWRSTARPPRV